MESVSHETLLDHLHDGICFVNRDKMITYWNTGAERITGFSREAIQGTTLGDDVLLHVDRDGGALTEANHPLQQCLNDSAVREEELHLRHQDGRVVPVFSRISPIRSAAGETIGAMEVFSDNSARMETLQRIEELEEMALLCPTTGVGNRRYAEMALENAFEELRRFGWPFGVLFVDLDHFKNVNDSFGHAVGDEILQMAAHALRSSLRSFDFVGRWGGEEFIVILPNITDEILLLVAERCRGSIESARYQHEGREISMTASLGAVIAEEGEDPEVCVARADALMYASKRAGRNRVTTEEAEIAE